MHNLHNRITNGIDTNQWQLKDFCHNRLPAIVLE